MDKSKQRMVLQQVPLFRELNSMEIERVEHIAIQRFYKKKSIIFTEGDEKEAVYFIADGLVKAFKTDEQGHEQIVSILKNGDMFPHIGFFNQDPYPATTEAMIDTELLAIPMTSFEQLLLNTPTIAVKLLGVLGAKIKELQERIQGFTGQDVNNRALSFLMKLAEQHGDQKGNTIRLHLPMTHQEFANAVGTTRESISRLFMQLRKDKIIQMDRNRIILIDTEAFDQWKKTNEPKA